MNREFFLVAVVIYPLTSLYFWAGLPFDNLCEDGEGSGKYQFCNQNMYSLLNTNVRGGVPHIELLRGAPLSTWFSDDQRRIAIGFGWIGLVCTILYILIFFRKQIIGFVLPLFKGSYEVSGNLF